MVSGNFRGTLTIQQRHSTFTAINRVEDEEDIEEHSRELQVELGFKLFEEALNAQKQDKYDEADAKYVELFDMEVLTARNSTNNPAIETLKYLCYRNRGFLRLSQIINKKEDTDVTESFEHFKLAIDDLLTALCHGKGDSKLMELLIQIFDHLEMNKLRRLVFEYELLKPELTLSDQSRTGAIFTDDDDIQYALNHPETMLPNQLSLVQSYKKFLDQLGVKSAQYPALEKIDFKPISRKGLDMSHFPTAKEFKELNKYERNIRVVELAESGDQVALVDVLKRINELPPKKGRSKIYDTYILTEEPIDKVEFELVQAIDKHEEQEPVAEFVENPTEEPITDEKEQNNVAEEPSSLNGDETPAKERKEPVPAAGNSAPKVTKRQTRANKEAEVNELTKDSFEGQFYFLENTLPNFLLLCGIKVESAGHLVDNILPKSESEGHPIEYQDIATLLNSWTKEDTETLFVKLDDTHNNEKSKEASVKEILSSFGKDTLEERITFEVLDGGKLKQLVLSLDDSQLQFNQIRLAILDHLFKVREHGGTLVTDGLLSADAIKQLRLFTDAVGLYVYKQMSAKLMNNSKLIGEGLEFGVSILELLVDYFISLKLDQKLKKYGSKALFNEVVQTEQITSRRIERWISLLDDYFGCIEFNKSISQLWLRSKWCHMCYLQNLSSFDPEILSAILTKMAEKSQGLDFHVLMINYPNIPRLNRTNLEVQLSKMKIFKAFTTNDSSNEILEKILVDDDQSKAKYTKEEKEMDEFISKSPFELKMRLWTMLFKFYRESKFTDKFLRGFERVLKIMLEELDGKAFTEKTFFQRKQAILKVLGFFDLFVKDLVEIGMSRQWQLQLSKPKEMIPLLYRVLTLTYMFLLHEDGAEQSNTRTSLKSRSKLAYNKFCDITVASYALLALYYSDALEDPKPEYINDFYGSLHEQLGLRHICSECKSAFLDLVEVKLAELEWDQSDNDFFQTLKCRYGLNISTESFNTFDHGNEPGVMQKQNAITVNKYMMKYCFKKKHPIFNVPKTDIKSVLDLIYDVLGDPAPEDYMVTNNMDTLSEYLESKSLNSRLMRFAFYGLLTIPFEDGTETAEPRAEGVYFMQGLLALTLFKIRKRTMQGRSAELDFVIKMFEYDIASGSNRFESWLLLAQAYSFLAEDDIIWTSDKLNNIDKKRNAASVQRKSLLCFFMALSVYAQLSDEQKDGLVGVSSLLWTSLGKELYNAMMSPMERLAITTGTETELTLPERSIVVVGANHPPLNVVIYRVLEICFTHACNLNPKDWYSYFYLGKSQSKLRSKKRTPLVMKNVLKSCELALKSSDKDDPIVEPHYYLCSTIYKLVMAGNLSIEEGMSYLKSDTLLQDQTFDATNHEEFGQLTIAVLQKCLAYDKKKWQHKPRYRIAKIYVDQFNDVESAKKEMLLLVNLRSTVRHLSNIWKPEYERPGKHFVYNYRYILFTVELLDKSNDVYSLFQLIKKLRKLGSSMIDQIKVFDYAVARTCSIIKTIVKVEPGFLDDTLSKLVYTEFISNCKEFVESMKKKETFTDEEKLILYFLSEVGEFRRMANGFAATGVIDECFHTLYLILFTRYLDSSKPEQPAATGTDKLAPQVEFIGSPAAKAGPPGTPSREKVKVARRDISPFCTQTIAAVSKLLDSIKREHGEGNFLKYTIDGETASENGKEVKPAVEAETKRSLDEEETGPEPKKLKLESEPENTPEPADK